MNCVKLLLHLFNIVSTMIGIVLIGIGIWTAVDKIYVSSIIGDTLFTAISYLLIVVGIIVITVSILGIYAVAKENFKLIIIYFAILVLSAVLVLIAGVLAVVFKTELESAMVDEMRKTLMDGYGSDRDIMDAWDKVQSDLKCCAVSEKLIGDGSNLYIGSYMDGKMPETENERQAQDSWAIYKRTDWYREQNELSESDKSYVPKSCCVVKSGDYQNLKYCQRFVSGPPTNYNTNLKNNYLYYDGCYDKAKDLMMEHVDIILGLGFVFAFFMISGVVLTFLMIRKLKNDQEEDTKRRREPDNL